SSSTRSVQYSRSPATMFVSKKLHDISLAHCTSAQRRTATPAFGEGGSSDGSGSADGSGSGAGSSGSCGSAPGSGWVTVGSGGQSEVQWEYAPHSPSPRTQLSCTQSTTHAEQASVITASGSPHTP